MSRKSTPKVQKVKADFSLKQRIATPLKYIFTAERIHAAQKMFDQSRPKLAQECLLHLKQMRELCTLPDPEMSHMTRNDLIRLSLNVKGSGSMADYPAATLMAEELYQFILRVEKGDATSQMILLTLIDAIRAVFAEKRQHTIDRLSAEVMGEIRESIEEYFQHL